MYQQKADCENVVLSAADKELLKKIKEHPHYRCDPKELGNLRFFELVQEDPSGETDPFHDPIGAGTYCVSDFYLVYEEYKKDRFREMAMQSLWLPIVVSIITNIIVDALQWLWPLITG